MTAKYASITLPRERYEQLHRLAKHHSTSARAVLATLIERELEATGVDRSIPGFWTGYRHGEKAADVVVYLYGRHIIAAHQAITEWAGFIETAVDLKGGGGTLDHGAALFADRHGNGIALSGVDQNGESFRVTVSADIATFIARELREAVRDLPEPH